MGYHFLLQGIIPTQGLNLGLLHCGRTPEFLYLFPSGKCIFLSFRSQHICHLLQLTQITLNYYLNYYLKIPIIVLVMCVCVLSHVCLFMTPWTVALQALLSMEFSRQEYWSGLPFLTPEDLPDPGIKPVSWPVDSLPLHLSYYAVIFIFIFSSSKLRVSQIKYKSSFFISPVYRIKSGT